MKEILIANPMVEVKLSQKVFVRMITYLFQLISLRNNMIVIALEPKSMLGIVTYKKFEKLLKESEDFPILRVISKN